MEAKKCVSISKTGRLKKNLKKEIVSSDSDSEGNSNENEFEIVKRNSKFSTMQSGMIKQKINKKHDRNVYNKSCKKTERFSNADERTSQSHEEIEEKRESSSDDLAEIAEEDELFLRPGIYWNLLGVKFKIQVILLR